METDASRSLKTTMRIGITCYPTYGGSGVVATELGIELAARGHDVHFISYAPPIRLNPTTRTSISMKWRSPPIRCSTTRRIRWRWRPKCRKWPNPSRSICCTCTTPFRIPSAPCWRARWPRRGACRSSPRCTARTSPWSATTAAICPSPTSPSSRATASPPSRNYLRERRP